LASSSRVRVICLATVHGRGRSLCRKTLQMETPPAQQPPADSQHTAGTDPDSHPATRNEAFQQSKEDRSCSNPADAKESDAPKKVVSASALSAASVVSNASQAMKQATRVFHVPHVVYMGGTLLAFCAGMVNAISFVALGRLVSHKTGSLTKVGLGFHDSDVADSLDAALLVISFLIGSTVCGMLIGKNTIHFGLALYDFCLLGISGLLIATTLLDDERLAALMAAAACGLQNGMATIWGGAVVRTTHVTGLVTDVGLLMGRLLSMGVRKRCGKKFDAFDRVAAEDDLSKLRVLATLGVAFLLGIFAGAYLESEVHRHAFLVPAAVTGGIGTLYAGYRVLILRRKFLDVTEMEVVDVPADILEDVGVLSAVETRGRAFSGNSSNTGNSNNSGSSSSDQFRMCQVHAGMGTTIASLDRKHALFVLEQSPKRKISTTSGSSSASAPHLTYPSDEGDMLQI